MTTASLYAMRARLHECRPIAHTKLMNSWGARP
jgi:hypothetical protein